jgi:hypothetical protein
LRKVRLDTSSNEEQRSQREELCRVNSACDDPSKVIDVRKRSTDRMQSRYSRSSTPSLSRSLLVIFVIRKSGREHIGGSERHYFGEWQNVCIVLVRTRTLLHEQRLTNGERNVDSFRAEVGE